MKSGNEFFQLGKRIHTSLETELLMQLKAIIKNFERPRDYYDIYILVKLQYSNIEFISLKEALNATVDKRGLKAAVKDYRKIMDTVRNSEIMQKQWDNYQKDFEYSQDIAFVDACDMVVQLMDLLMRI